MKNLNSPSARRGKLSDSEARDANRELHGMFDKALAINQKWRVRCVDGPLQGYNVETLEPQKLFSLFWPPDKEATDRKLFTYRAFDWNRKKGIIYMRVDRRVEK